ncbi:MAG: hypothetical protein AAF721_26565, partial [Myxococcota bacterium]
MCRQSSATSSLLLAAAVAAVNGCTDPVVGGQTGAGTGQVATTGAHGSGPDGELDTTGVAGGDSTATGAVDDASDSGPGGTSGSQGTSGSGDSDSGEQETGGSTTGTPLMPVDVSPPEWVGVVDGHMSLTVPDAVPLAGDRVALTVGATHADSPLEFGAGEPGSTLLQHNRAASALALYDAQSGEVQSARLIGEAVEDFAG